MGVGVRENRGGQVEGLRWSCCQVLANGVIQQQEYRQIQPLSVEAARTHGSARQWVHPGFAARLSPWRVSPSFRVEPHTLDLRARKQVSWL